MTLHSIRLLPWQLLSAAQQAQVRSISISAVQVEFAGAVEKQLASVEAESGEDLAGLAILAADGAAGFLVVKRASKAPKWAPPHAAVVSGMRIDQGHQGMGIGSSALALLPGWLRTHWPGCSEVTLSVDEENVRGINAYARAGFRDLGQRVQGRIGWVRYMSRPLNGTAEHRRDD